MTQYPQKRIFPNKRKRRKWRYSLWKRGSSFWKDWTASQAAKQNFFLQNVGKLANELADFQRDFLGQNFPDQTVAELFSRFHNIQSVALAFLQRKTRSYFHSESVTSLWRSSRVSFSRGSRCNICKIRRSCSCVSTYIHCEPARKNCVIRHVSVRKSKNKPRYYTRSLENCSFPRRTADLMTRTISSSFQHYNYFFMKFVNRWKKFF